MLIEKGLTKSDLVSPLRLRDKPRWDILDVFPIWAYD